MLKSFGRDFIIYGISSTISSLIGIVLIPLYTRYFTVDEFGAQDLILVIVIFTATIGMMQLESAVGRYFFAEKIEAQRNRMISTAFWSILSFSMFLFLFFVLFSSNISSLLFGNTTYKYVLMVAALKIPVSNLNALFTVIMRFKKKAVHYLIFQATKVVLTIGVSVLLIAYYKTGIIGAFIGMLSGWLIAALGMGYYLRSHLKPIWCKTTFRKMMRYSLPLLPSVTGNKANSYMSRFVLLGYLSVTEIGIFAVALRVASIFHIIGAAFRMTWPPFFWDTFENNPNHRSIFSRLHQHITIIVVSLVIIVTLFSDEIISVFATEEYFYAAKLVGFLTLSAAITSIIEKITGLGPGITKKTEYNTIIFFVGIAVNIGLLFLLVPSIGLMGVPISLLLSTLARLTISWFNSEKLYYIGFKIPPAMICIILAIVVIIIDVFLQLDLSLKVILTAIIISSGSFIYRKKLIDILSLWKRR